MQDKKPKNTDPIPRSIAMPSAAFDVLRPERRYHVGNQPDAERIRHQIRP